VVDAVMEMDDIDMRFEMARDKLTKRRIARRMILAKAKSPRELQRCERVSPAISQRKQRR
jgi:hypothetical protein